MKSDINVTPLVDVCLVLLIIFMAVNDELAHGKSVPLPGAANAELLGVSSEQRLISVANAGGHAQLWWGHSRVADLADLRQRIAAESGKARPTLIQADADLPYGAVYPVLIAVREAGASSLSLGTRSFEF